MSLRSLIKSTIVTYFSIINIAIPVLAADFSAPMITVSIQAPDNSRTAFRIKAVVTDDSGVDSVKLYYRIIGREGKFNSMPMEPVTVYANSYFVELPAEMYNVQGIDFYVEARDIANNVAQEPHPSKAKQFNFKLSEDYELINKHTHYYFAPGSQWGAGISYGRYTVDDPDGDTGSTDTAAVSLLFNYTLSKTWRSWTELNITKFRLPYSEQEIGQDVRAIHLDFIFQRGVPLFDSSTWLGVGYGFGYIEYIDRSTSINGVIGDAFEDREEANHGYIVDIGYELGPVSRKMIGIQAKYFKSQNEGVDRTTIGMYVTFH